MDAKSKILLEMMFFFWCNTTLVRLLAFDQNQSMSTGFREKVTELGKQRGEHFQISLICWALPP